LSKNFVVIEINKSYKYVQNKEKYVENKEKERF